MKIAKILQLAGRKFTWTHRESQHAEQQLCASTGLEITADGQHGLTGQRWKSAQKLHISCTGFASCLCWTAEVFKNWECATVHEHTEHLRKLGQAEPLTAALPDFSLVLAQRLHCTQLHSDNFYTYTPTHTNMSWHTLIALNQASICMRKPPRRALMNLPI